MSRAAPVWRIVRAHGGPLVAVAVVTFVATVLAALVVPVLGALATAGLQFDLRRAIAAERDLQVRYTVTEPGTPDPQAAFDGIADALGRARGAMPEPLRSAVGPGESFAQTDPLLLDAEPSKVPAYVSLTADPGFAGRTHIVRGRAARGSDGDGTVEVVLSRAVARAIGWPVGTTRTVGSVAGATSVRLVGLYAADAPEADAWQQTPTTLRPGLRALGPGGTAVLGTAYVDPGSFDVLAAAGATTGRAWFPLRTASVDVEDRGALTDQTRTLLGRALPLPSTVTGTTRITTGLPELLDGAAARTASVTTLTAALGSGPLVALIGVQVLVARLTLERDRARWVLLAARGAGRRTRAFLAAALVGVAAVPAALLGAVTAGVVGSLSGTVASGTGVGLVALVGAALPCLAAAVLVPSDRGRRWRGRIVLEVIVVVLTVVAVAAVLRDGIGTGVGGGFDPLTAAVPVLLAATGTVAVLRLRPVVLGVVVRRRRRDADLPEFLGTVTAARRTGAGFALAVAVAGIAVALFGSVVGSTLEDGLARSAQQSVGADVAVEAPAIDPDQVRAVGAVPGVAAAVGVATTGSAQVTTRGGSVTAVVVAADTRRLLAVQRGVVGAVPLPSALRSEGGSGTGDAVPVVVSESLARDLARSPDVDGTRLRVVRTVPDDTSFTAAARWMLVDDRHADALLSSGSVDRVLVRLRPDARPDRVEQLVSARVDGATIRTSASVTRQRTADPRVPGVQAIALVTAAAGVLVGVGALGAAGVLAGPVRRERGRLLRVLGLDPGRGRRLVAVEAAPTLVSAVASGVVVAVGLVLVVLPAADLRSFTGSAAPPGVSVDPVLFGGTLVVVAAALLVALGTEVAAGTPPRTDMPPAPRSRGPHHRTPTRSRP